ncbi:NAD(P)/FAD-dependent oxidoreductase [Pseudooceanicola onchidii]|uniref:NAD(P)/FAD-dependent oxidoreductase n=1 Tax=Pseudooceanicola onchidii TaxID=2562279 RepID=UPI0010AAF203|nr:FAD-binding oxidoreductase [Pseudooceanicola onchidii]
MNLLHSNDRPGQYPPSYYAATATPLPPFPVLKGAETADVCIIGAGFTGLSAALHAAEAGLSVILVEAQRVGFGASGRNGGQLGSGQRQDQMTLEKMVGMDDAQHFWKLGEEAKEFTKSLIFKHDIDVGLTPGVAWTGSSRSEVQHLHDYAAHLDARYGYSKIDTPDDADFARIIPSPAYKGGIIDRGAAHLHPLKFSLGLAKAATSAGVKIFERSEVHHVVRGSKVTVRTGAGQVTADHLLLACNGYLGTLDRRVAARVMPINNFIAATEPLGPDAAKVLGEDIAVADDKFVVNYYRLSEDGRLLFGGGESYGYRFPHDIAAKVRRPMTEIYPHLRDVKIDYAWGGTLAITMKRLPYFARLAPNILTASGYSGHGLGTATHAGYLMAQAIRGQAEGFDAMSRLPNTPFPGGAALRTPFLVAAMSWFALRDRLGI